MKKKQVVKNTIDGEFTGYLKVKQNKVKSALKKSFQKLQVYLNQKDQQTSAYDGWERKYFILKSSMLLMYSEN